MIVVVLPAYNEEQGLRSLLGTMADVARESAVETRVIVVNDGSSDRTHEVASGFADRLGVEVVDHPENRGLAEALRTGFSHALDRFAGRQASPSDVVVTMDSDDTHSPWLIPRMVAVIREGSDVVIASRYRPGAAIRGVSTVRRLLSWGGGWVFRAIQPIPGVRDYTCGFRAYRVSLLQQAYERYGDRFITEKGFSCMADILLKLRPLEPIMTELPLVLRYDRKLGASKMRVGNTVLRSLQLAVRRRLGRFD